MRILSIDVGIKNLALCSIDASSGGISDWQVINLCDKEPSCQHSTRKGLCGKSARFSKNNLLYCSAHAAKSGFQLPKQVPTCATLKKLDDTSLHTKASQLNIADGESLTKAKLASKIRAKMLEEAMITIPPQNANTIELPELARILQKRLDTSVVIDGLDEVIIENQISPIANRMKCLQSMLTQYFSMRGIPSIKFVSAANKLRFFNAPKSTYAERKKLSIEVVRSYLQSTSSSHQEEFEAHDKKDDLADALLQGLAYLVSAGCIDNIILNADYLK
jgi:hypothetical protein